MAGARDKPIIRLEDGSQVAPFDDEDRPAVYLPGPALAGQPAHGAPGRSPARPPPGRSWQALSLTEPDLIAEVLQIILPRYDDLDLAGLDPARHDADVECVVRALDEAAAGRREELLERVAADRLPDRGERRHRRAG